MENCIFCKIVSGEFNSYKVYEDEHSLAFLDINPIAEYHTIVIPKAHYVNAFDIPADVLSHVMHAAKQVVDLYAKTLGLTNLQILHNAGRDAGQEVFHLHMHIIPRKAGDGIKINWVPRSVSKDELVEMLRKLK